MMPMTIFRQPNRGGGGVTITLKLHTAMPPQLLVAVQVTAVVPIGKILPDGGEYIIGPVFPVAVAE